MKQRNIDIVTLGLSIVAFLLAFYTLQLLLTSPPEPSRPTGATLPISEPTGRTYNPQQTIDGKTLQGSEL